MKDTQITKQIEFLGTYYEITRHIGSECISIFELIGQDWRGRNKWRRIYMGHIEPLEEALAFFKESKSI